MIKILAIGNSFSQDATAMLEMINPDIFVRNLYIGGCSLEQHWGNIEKDAKAYDYEENGERCKMEKVSVSEALAAEKWDYITVQQVSHLSGQKESYFPYIDRILDYIKQRTSAKILLHRTWAYEYGNGHTEFYRYDNDCEKMYEAIAQVTKEIATSYHLPIIDVGGFIHRLRRYDFFDVTKGGVSLYRDKFHLSMGCGRLAAALVWSKFFGGETPSILRREELGEGLAIIKTEIERKG